MRKTVDVRNPAPPEMYKTLKIMGSTVNLNWLAGFLNHQQYEGKTLLLENAMGSREVFRSSLICRFSETDMTGPLPAAAGSKSKQHMK